MSTTGQDESGAGSKPAESKELSIDMLVKDFSMTTRSAMKLLADLKADQREVVGAAPIFEKKDGNNIFMGIKYIFKKVGDESFSDSLTMDMDLTKIVVKDGVLRAPCVMTAAMVQDYDGTPVLKCPDELKAAVGFCKQLPITDGHPKEKLVTSQDEIKGWTTVPKWNDEKKRVECDVEITDAALIKKITDDKKTAVSIGFNCNLDFKDGKFGDSPYKAIQRNMVLNHLAAGIDAGRCPAPTCGVGVDAAPPAKDPAPEIKPGGSNAGEYSKEDGPFCGPDGGAPEGTYPCGTLERAKAALSLAHNAPNPEGIRACVLKKWPVLMPKDGFVATIPSPDDKHPDICECDKCKAKKKKMDEEKAAVEAKAKADQEALAHEVLAQEVIAAIQAIASKLATSMTTMSIEEFNALTSDLEKLQWKLKDFRAVTKNLQPKMDEAMKVGDSLKPTIDQAKNEVLKLIDSIMDFKPPQGREHFNIRSRAQLADDLKLLQVGAGKLQASESLSQKDAVAKVYADAIKKRHGK